jgi:hypothetical protein
MAMRGQDARSIGESTDVVKEAWLFAAMRARIYMMFGTVPIFTYEVVGVVGCRVNSTSRIAPMIVLLQHGYYLSPIY